MPIHLTPTSTRTESICCMHHRLRGKTNIVREWELDPNSQYQYAANFLGLPIDVYSRMSGCIFSKCSAKMSTISDCFCMWHQLIFSPLCFQRGLQFCVTGPRLAYRGSLIARPLSSTSSAAQRTKFFTSYTQRFNPLFLDTMMPDVYYVIEAKIREALHLVPKGIKPNFSNLV